MIVRKILRGLVLLTCACTSTTPASSTDATPANYGTPQDCAEAGGRCILGLPQGCAQLGPPNTCNCNPQCNPGGGICCLALVDAGDASSE
jgi:hypothetical protein